MALSTKVLDDLDLTDEERAWVEASRTATTADISLSRAIGDVYTMKHAQRNLDRQLEANAEATRFLVEHIEKAVKDLIAADERLSESTEKHTRVTIWLTTVLAAAAVVQVGVMVANWLAR